MLPGSCYLGYSPGQVGLLLGIFEISGIIGPLVMSHVTDTRGRYRVGLVVAYLLIPVSLIPLNLWKSIWISGAALIVLAVGIRSIIPLLDAAATLLLQHREDYGKIRAVGSLSFVLTAVLLQYTPVLPPLRANSISLWLVMTAGIALITLPLLSERKARSAGEGEAFAAISVNESTKTPSAQVLSSGNYSMERTTVVKQPMKHWPSVFWMGLLIIGLSRLSMAPVVSFFSLYVTEELGWNAVGLLWALSALSEIPFMFLSGPLLRRFGAPALLALSTVGVIARLSIYALFPTMAGAVFGQLLHSLCYGIFHPAAVAFVSTHVPPEQRALGLSMYLSFGVGFPTFLGSSLAGYIVEGWGYRVLFGSFTLFGIIALGLYRLFFVSQLTKRQGSA
ncbi:MAG: MFS transporter [Termitinemataceae bacterium]